MKRSLDKITIKGFKSIKELIDFELRGLNVLIGGNGAGKSNFVEFFRVISAMMKKGGLKEYIAGNADSYLFGGPKITSVIDVSMSFGFNGYDFTLSPTEDGFFMITNEMRHYFPHKEIRDYGTSAFNPELPRETAFSEASNHTYNAITSWTIYHFHDTSKEAGMRRYQDAGHNEKLFTDASNIAPFLRMLKEKYPESYKEILNAVRLVIPFFDDFILKTNQNENIRLNWRQKGLKDYPMRPTHLSDGSIRFICLATALLQPEPPSTIIIDEPELGLHPEAIAILAELINVASKRTQIIVATQSPALVDYYAIEDIVIVKRDAGASLFERLKEEDFSAWLEDYSVGELWKKNVIAGGPVYE